MFEAAGFLAEKYVQRDYHYVYSTIMKSPVVFGRIVFYERFGVFEKRERFLWSMRGGR